MTEVRENGLIMYYACDICGKKDDFMTLNLETDVALCAKCGRVK